ncbi:hypothetical protein KAJ89_00840 [Candidatus Parcubacteria bacterium]|nr:hypothetical protein [Candidatus Parcubacteria bacterium]
MVKAGFGAIRKIKDVMLIGELNVNKIYNKLDKMFYISYNMGRIIITKNYD